MPVYHPEFEVGTKLYCLVKEFEKLALKFYAVELWLAVELAPSQQM